MRSCKPNVLFIVIDTLRKDHAEVLWGSLEKMGFIRYNGALTTSPWTTPSHVSIFTGMYPIYHGSHETRSIKGINVRVKKHLYLVQELKSLGYRTYLLTANAWVSPHVGFRGFDYVFEAYDKLFNLLLSDEEYRYLFALNRKLNYDKVEVLKHLFRQSRYGLIAKSMIQHVLKRIFYAFYRVVKYWPLEKGSKYIVRDVEDNVIKQSGAKFIFINFMEVHEPYLYRDKIAYLVRQNLKTGQPFDQKILMKWRKAYSRQVNYLTRRLTNFFNTLNDKGLFDDSLVIVTSDHGQLLGEHNRVGHGVFLYKELLEIPLFIKYPRKLEIDRSERGGYISLANMRGFIRDLVRCRARSDEKLYVNTAFAESYGIHIDVGEIRSEIEKKNIDELEKYRIAVYYNGYRGVFNVVDWVFEEVTSIEGGEAEDSIRKEMLKAIVRYLKTAMTLKKLSSI